MSSQRKKGGGKTITAATLRARSEKKTRVLRQAAERNYQIEEAHSPSSRSPPPPRAPSTSATTSLNSTTNSSTATSPLPGGSPDQRRVQKLESGVLDLSVRELLDKDLQGVMQLIEVCSVHSLCIAHNSLTQLNLPIPSQLVYLDISHNQIESLGGRGLNSLVNLRTLMASHNQLTSMVGLDHNLLLNTIDLSHNEIVEAEPLPAHSKLYELNLSFNCIDDIDNIRTMALSHMQVLHLRGNPIAFDGTNYRLMVSHMLPKVRVLDEIMQSPSPYVSLDEISDSPARRDEAHVRATGHIFGNAEESRGRAHWAQKPNVVIKSKKSSLSYSTIHARKVAAASAATLNKTSSPAAAGTAKLSLASMPATTPSKGVKTKASHMAVSSSSKKQRQRRGGRTSPTKNQISRDPPSSVAMQMTKNHIERERMSPKVVISMPRASSEQKGSTQRRRQQKLRKVRSKVDSHMSPNVMKRTRGHHNGDIVHGYADQEDHHRTVHNTTYPRHSMDGGEQGKSQKRQETHGFGRKGSFNKNDFDVQSMRPNLTPRTLAFASNLRGSGKKKSPRHSATTAPLLNGNRSKKSAQKRRDVSATSSMKKRLQQRKQNSSDGNNLNRPSGSSGLRIETDFANDQLLYDERDDGVIDDKPMTYRELDEKISEDELSNSSTFRNNSQSVGDKNKHEEQEKEWNSILEALINQKRESLALLYKSLTNERESQTRMVNSSNTVANEATESNKLISGIHVDRGGNVTSYLQ
jgi:hypothetical protein